MDKLLVKNLLIILVALLIGLGVTRWVVRRLKRLKSFLHDTKHLGRMILQAQTQPDGDNEHEARSLNGMDAIYRPQIAGDFPDLQVDLLQCKAQALLLDAYRALEDGRSHHFLETYGPYMAKALERQMTGHQNLNRWAPQFSDMKIHRGVLSAYNSQGDTKTITFQFALEAYVSCEEHPEKIKRQYRDEVTYSYTENPALFAEADRDGDGIVYKKCPNCGAPLQDFRQRTCPYCSTGLKQMALKSWLPIDIRLEAWTKPNGIR